MTLSRLLTSGLLCLALGAACTTSVVATAPPTTPVAGTAGPAALAGVVKPDPAFTPGEVNPAVSQATISQTICLSGWTATIRPPESYTEQVKHLEAGAGGVVTYQAQTYVVHGFELADRDISHYELDHYESGVAGSRCDISAGQIVWDASASASLS